MALDVCCDLLKECVGIGLDLVQNVEVLLVSLTLKSEGMVNNGQVVSRELLGKALEGSEGLLVSDVSLNDLGHLFAVVFSTSEGLASLSFGTFHKKLDSVVRIELNMLIVT